MDTLSAKVRVIAITNSEDAKDQLEEAAKKKVEEWQKKHKTAISKLKDASRGKFYEIANQANNSAGRTDQRPPVLVQLIIFAIAPANEMAQWVCHRLEPIVS